MTGTQSWTTTIFFALWLLWKWWRNSLIAPRENDRLILYWGQFLRLCTKNSRWSEGMTNFRNIIRILQFLSLFFGWFYLLDIFPVKLSLLKYLSHLPLQIAQLPLSKPKYTFFLSKNFKRLLHFLNSLSKVSLCSSLFFYDFANICGVWFAIL